MKIPTRKITLTCLLATLYIASPAVATPAPSALQAADAAALETWSASLALQAATWGAPLVTMYALRYHDALGPNAKAKPNEIWRMDDISTPALSEKAGYVTPNVNTVYGFGFMDLRQEPVILSVPNSHGRYYVVQLVDMWTNAFAYVGGKATGYQGGKFALVGPGWKGSLPKGVKRIDCPTSWILVQPRVHSYDHGHLDIAGARKILAAIQTEPLSQYLGQAAPAAAYNNYPAPLPINPNLPVSALQYQNPLQFWELLSIALIENPPPADQVTALLPMFRPLGLTLEHEWKASSVSPIFLASMKQAALDIGPLLAHLPVGQFSQGALFPPPTIGNFGTDYMTRAVVGRVGLTANTPTEAVYWQYGRDSQGQGLSGTKNYTMTFKSGIPYEAPGFWSLTLYDARNNYTVPNSIHRYMIGSDSPQLLKNPDGSFTIYIQATNPGPAKAANWLPAPAGPFYLIARAYAPKPAAVNILTNPKSWPVPAVVPAPLHP